MYLRVLDHCYISVAKPDKPNFKKPQALIISERDAKFIPKKQNFDWCSDIPKIEGIRGSYIRTKMIFFNATSKEI